MTPKEKAKHLLWKYLPILEGWKELDSFKAKQCALIAVDEIMDILDKEGYYEDDNKMRYWQEVKQEIKKYEINTKAKI